MSVLLLCNRCHREGSAVQRFYNIPQDSILKNYTESIHGEGLLKSGLVVTATCADCHSPHGELPAANPASTVNRANIATTCGKCHQQVTESYFETYHGKVSKLGFMKTAKGYDCHGAHDILKVTDPNSPLSRNHIVKTCQQCHPGSNRRFAGYLTHATHHDPKQYPVLFFAFWGMTGLLVVTFVFAGLHTLALLPRSLQYRKMLQQTHALESPQHVRRFPKLYRNRHLMVISSFLALAITGMTLKFPTRHGCSGCRGCSAASRRPA